MIYDNDHTFSETGEDDIGPQAGMDLRTYLTGQSIPAAAIYFRFRQGVSPAKIAERAVQIADAAIAELNRK
jgi:hypothetical protein